MNDTERAPTVGIIGLGYVGLSYAVAFAANGGMRCPDDRRANAGQRDL
ncbi:MAG: hypothetical protein LC793_02830 [Thermomicrobia bacterium]|nr:hypothetical protein [Thermomicrobia bacterium]